MIRRSLSAGFVLFAAVCLLAGPASAQDGDDDSNGNGYYQIGSLMGVVLSDGSVDVTGTCDPGDSVNLVASTGDEVDATADDNGSFAVNVVVSTDPGTYSIEVSCENGATGVLGVEITADDGDDTNGAGDDTNDGALARTGPDSAGTLAATGALLVGLGGAALFLGRRRMNRNTA